MAQFNEDLTLTEKTNVYLKENNTQHDEIMFGLVMFALFGFQMVLIKTVQKAETKVFSIMIIFFN